MREASDELSSLMKAACYRTPDVVSMNDNNSDGIQVSSDVITHISSPLSSAHLDHWLADITQRQHAAAADRLSKITCDCTFCAPDVTGDSLTTLRTTKIITTTSTTTTSATTTSSKPVFTCVSCARNFASAKYLNMHAALHRKSSSSSPRSTVSSLQALTLTAGSAAKDKWTCEVCGKVFAHTSNYKNHIRTHSDERPFVCHVCSIGFKERYHLKKHTLFKHTGELNEACRRCGKRFKDSTAVRAHERIHSDARPYACHRCGKAFKTSECLWHHDHRSKTCGRPVRRSVDITSPLSGTCKSAEEHQPGDSLASLTDLVDQSTTMAGADVKLLFPRRAVTASQNTRQSMVKTEDAMYMLSANGTHDDSSQMIAAPVNASADIPWLSQSTKPVAVVIGQHITGSGGIKQRSICSRCGKQFASSLAFERHLAVHSLTRPYRCHICDVGFKLKVHLKKHNLYRHNSDYPCQCRVCGKPFKDSSAVRLHERIHSSARPFQCACGKSFKTRENLWGHRHRRPCVGRYTACAAAAVCVGGLSQSCMQDTASSATLTECVVTPNRPPAVFDATQSASHGVGSAPVLCTDNLLMFDGSDDCVSSVDSKLLPPFETFIPPLRTGTTDTTTNSALTPPVLRNYHYNFTDCWSSADAAVPHDVIWWSSASNYQSSAAIMSHYTVDDVTDDVIVTVTDDVRAAGDWSSDWQLSRKLSL